MPINNEPDFGVLKEKREQWKNQPPARRRELLEKHLREDLQVSGTIRRNGRTYDAVEYILLGEHGPVQE